MTNINKVKRWVEGKKPVRKKEKKKKKPKNKLKKLVEA